MHRVVLTTHYRLSALTLTLIFGVVALHSHFSHADEYSWIGGSQSWTDPMNWVSTSEPVSLTYPDGDDVALFSIPATISLEGGQSVSTADVRAETVSFTNGTLQVNGFNLLRVGAGAIGSLELLSGGNTNGNGTLAGVDATGKIWVRSGSTLHDANQISIGYTNTGELHLVNGGKASSDGPIFVGGFSSGDGDVLISDSGSQLSANSFIVVGNLGTGSLIADSGGAVQSTGNFEIGGFASGTGEVHLYDAGTKLTVGQNLVVGNSGQGALEISDGATATTQAMLVGGSNGSHGDAYVQHQNSKLTVQSPDFTIGDYGQGSFSVTEGARLDAKAITLGAQSSGFGMLRVEGANSIISIPHDVLTVGGQGRGVLQVFDGGKLYADRIVLGSGSGLESTATLDGAESYVEVTDQTEIGTNGKATIQITGGSDFSTNEIRIGAGDDGNVTVDGSGSRLLVGGGSGASATSLRIGGGGMATLTIQGGGTVEANGRVEIGEAPSGEGNLILDGSASVFSPFDLSVGSDGQGTMTIRNGGSFTPISKVFVGQKGDAQGMLIVEGVGSAYQSDTKELILGAEAGTATGSFVVKNQAHATAPVQVHNGTVEVSGGGHLDALIFDAEVQADKSFNLTVKGAGSRLDSHSDMILGDLGAVAAYVEDSAVLNAPAIRLRTSPGASNSPVSLRVHTNANVTADEIIMSLPTATLEVSGGGHVWVKSSLSIGSAVLSLAGGSIDVGSVPPFGSQTNFVNVGSGGYFSASTSVPNLHNIQGSVQVGHSPGVLTVSGNYTQDAGSTTSFSIAGTQVGSEYSQLVVGGNLQLSGKLTFNFENAFEPQVGQTFDLITVGGSAQLANYQVEIKNLGAGFQYSFAPFAGGYRLTVLSAGEFEPTLPGDFSGNGVVDAADYVVWRDHLGTTLTQADYAVWRSHFGQAAAAGGSLASNAAVPEPNVAPLLAIVASAFLQSRRSKR